MHTKTDIGRRFVEFSSPTIRAYNNFFFNRFSLREQLL